MQPTSFTTPGTDYGVELGQIERKRALAQAIQQQSMQETPQQTAGGWVVPSSPLQGAAKMAQAFAARKLQDKTDLKQQQLSTKIQNDYRSMLAKGLGQLQGTPGRTIQPDPQEAQQSADYGTPQVGAVNQPAQAPDPMGAMATFGSHPMGQQMVPLAMQEMQRQRLAQALRGGAVAQGTPQGAPGAMPTGGVQAGSPPSGGAGGLAGGLPLEAWLQIDPTGKAYADALGKQQITPYQQASLQQARDLHSQPSGSAQLGAQTSLQNHLTPSGNARMVDARESLKMERDKFGNPIEVTGPNGPMLAMQNKGNGVMVDANTRQPVGPLGPKIGESAQKQQTGVANTQSAIGEYRDALKKFSVTDLANPASRARMGTVYNNMLLQAKEAYNLGVLNGPDYMILQQVITNPASMTGALTSKKALDDQAAKLDEIMGKIGGTVSQTQSGLTPTRRGSDDPLGLRTK